MNDGVMDKTSSAAGRGLRTKPARGWDSSLGREQRRAAGTTVPYSQRRWRGERRGGHTQSRVVGLRLSTKRRYGFVEAEWGACDRINSTVARARATLESTLQLSRRARWSVDVERRRCASAPDEVAAALRGTSDCPLTRGSQSPSANDLKRKLTKGSARTRASSSKAAAGTCARRRVKVLSRRHRRL